jgi:peptide deformylase
MQLIKSPDPWLEKKVKPFDFENLDAETISNEMLEIMDKEGGIGLSANQVGLDAQIFVMKPHLLENKEAFAVINPSLESVTVNYEEMPEGCLSHPSLFLKVKRPRGIIAKYLDTNAKECKIELYDIDARCFLHEYDHLQGIEFTDRVSRLKLDMAKKKQSKILKLQRKQKQNG